MFRFVPRPAVACLLLLCLLRTLLPETWVLAWHAHAHTTHEAAFEPGSASHVKPGGLLLSTRHQHCHAEQFYDVPFAAGAALLLPVPLRRPRYQAYAPVARPAGLRAVALSERLRGPPLA